MYMDKLDGRISQDLFDRQAASMRREQDGLLREIQGIEQATPAPIEQASICLANESSERVVPPAACQRAASIAPDGCRKGVLEGRLPADSLFEPFEILRHSN